MKKLLERFLLWALKDSYVDELTRIRILRENTRIFVSSVFVSDYELATSYQHELVNARKREIVRRIAGKMISDDGVYFEETVDKEKLGRTISAMVRVIKCEK